MDHQRFSWLIERFSSLRVLVVGDFFLDRYMVIDHKLSEISLETGLEAYQVVDIRTSPGAAGNVAANLASLGAQVSTLGVIGMDGHGYELKRELIKRGIETRHLSEHSGIFTPTYIKPLICEPDGHQHEIERQDVKNRSILPVEIERRVIEDLCNSVPGMSGVIVVDQVQEENCGVITDGVRHEIEALSIRYPELVFAVDSRMRIGEYRNMMIKPNGAEAVAATMQMERKPDDGSWVDFKEEATDELVLESGKALFRRSGKPVFLTLGDRGVMVFNNKGVESVPALRVHGPIDPVGAGDSFMAGLVLALCSGAVPVEAAVFGNLVAAVTIQQVGTTGTATPDQLKEIYQRQGD